MKLHTMRWATLLLCTLVFAACGSTTPVGTTNSSSAVLNDPTKLPSAGTVIATLSGVGGGGKTGDTFGIAADDTAVWIHNSAQGTVVRVDPRTNQVVATIPVGHGEGDVVLEAGAVWVLDRDDYAVSRIDPATNQVVATITLPKLQGNTIHLRISLSVSPGGVWVTREDMGVGWKIDIQTNQVTETIYDQDGPAWMAFAAGSLWVCNRDSVTYGVMRLDPANGQVVEKIDIGDGKGYGCDGIVASSDGAVWAELAQFSNTDPYADVGLVRIDPATNKVVFTLAMPGSDVINPLAADAQGVWTAKPDLGLIRVSPKTNQAIGFLSMSGASGVVVAAGLVWVINNDGDLMRVTPAA